MPFLINDVRTCSDCGEEKPIDAFHVLKYKGEPRYHHSHCKKCGLVRHKQWRDANPEKMQAWSRRGRLRRYGLTPEDYEQKLASQGGGCAVCGDPPKPNRCLPVDHDHKTGETRDIICDGCNAALGMVDDDVTRLTALIAYLIKWGK